MPHLTWARTWVGIVGGLTLVWSHTRGRFKGIHVDYTAHASKATLLNWGRRHIAVSPMGTKKVIVEFQEYSRIVKFQESEDEVENATAAVEETFHDVFSSPPSPFFLQVFHNSWTRLICQITKLYIYNIIMHSLTCIKKAKMILMKVPTWMAPPEREGIWLLMRDWEVRALLITESNPHLCLTSALTM